MEADRTDRSDAASAPRAAAPPHLPWLPNFSAWIRQVRPYVLGELLVSLALELMSRGDTSAQDILDYALQLRHRALWQTAGLYTSDE